MNVLRCYLALPPCPGGMEQHIAELSRRQRRQGNQVTQAYSIGNIADGSGFRVLAGWPILHLWPHSVRDVIFYSAVCWHAWRNDVRADVVHVHGDWSAYLCGAILRRVVGAKILCASMHGYMSIGFIRRWLYRFSAAAVHVGYATGVREAKQLSEVSGRDWPNITSGVSDVFFQSASANEVQFDVVIVGSLVAVKGVDLALEVARILPHRRFCIVGDGPEIARLTAISASLENCEFLGRKEPREVAQILRSSRLMLVTSHREGTPTATLEAMACGLPVVTTASNYYDELLSDGGGKVVPVRGAVEIAAAIEGYLSDEILLARVRRRNSLTALSYSWDHIAQRVSDLMRSGIEASADKDAPRNSDFR